MSEAWEESREAAIRAKPYKHRYTSAQACAKCGTFERVTNSAGCVECLRLRNAARRRKSLLLPRDYVSRMVPPIPGQCPLCARVPCGVNPACILCRQAEGFDT